MNSNANKELLDRLTRLEEEVKRLRGLYSWMIDHIAEPLPLEEAVAESQEVHAEEQPNGDIFIALPGGMTLTIGRWERSE